MAYPLVARLPFTGTSMQLRPFVTAVPIALTLLFSAAAPAPAAGLAVLGAPAQPASDNTPRGPRIYNMPFPAGFSFTMCQGNNQGSHTGNGKYAWDFCMPIGTPVTASRGGTVTMIRQDFTEHGVGPAFADKNNYVVVDHGDGTSGLYMHLMHMGVRVKVGQHVDTGQLLAYSGNTGWSGGPHGVGTRIKIAFTRAMVHAILNALLKDVPTVQDPIFGLFVPESCPGVPKEFMNQRDTWTDQHAYDAKARELAERFKQNFEQFASSVNPEVKAAGPK